jgi:hypothetical protein
MSTGIALMRIEARTGEGLFPGCLILEKMIVNNYDDDI